MQIIPLNLDSVLLLLHNSKLAYLLHHFLYIIMQYPSGLIPFSSHIIVCIVLSCYFDYIVKNF